MNVFIPKNREMFYCRITIPLRLWPLIGRKEIWRSLQTADKDLAVVRAEKWKASGKRLFLILKREGYRMNKKTIDDLVQRWLDELLDEEWPPRPSADYADYEELLQEQRLDNRWNHMAEQADDLLQSAGLSLDHGDTLFRLLCQRLLEGHIEYTRVQQDRLNGNYRPFNHSKQVRLESLSQAGSSTSRALASQVSEDVTSTPPTETFM